MINYDKFKANFEVQNKHLKIALLVTTIIFSISLLMFITQRRYFMYSGGEIFKDRPLSVEICRLSFLGIAKGNPNSYVITDGVMDIIKNDPFLIAIDEILLLKSQGEAKCKIVLKSDGELIAFNIALDQSDSYPFQYKLAQLDEIRAEGEL